MLAVDKPLAIAQPDLKMRRAIRVVLHNRTGNERMVLEDPMPDLRKVRAGKLRHYTLLHELVDGIDGHLKRLQL